MSESRKTLLAEEGGLMTEETIPKEWCKTTLGTVVDYGKTTKASPGEIADETWVLELEDIEKDSSKLLQKVSYGERKSKSTKNRFNRGDVLYGKLRPYLNKVIIATDEGVCTTEIIPLEAGNKVDSHFLFHWLKSPDFLAYVNRVGYGVNMPRLGTKDGVAAPFILPPLAEQQEIASRLDDLLAQVETLKTRLDGIPAILKRFRQATLAAAVSGKLTEEWRGDAERDKSHPPPSWKEIKLSDLGTILTGSTPSKKNPSFYGGDFPMFKPSDLDNGYYVTEGSDYLSEDGKKKCRIIPAGSILVTCIGATIGKTGYSRVEGTCNQQINAILPGTEIVPEWVYFLMCSSQLQHKIVKNSSSTTLPIINKGRFSQLRVNKPPVEEQTEIVRRVEELFAFADQIEQRVKEAQARVGKLTQSILAKAFRGDLTADWRTANPNLITGPNSAEALLKWIKEEREKLGKKKMNRKRKG